MQSNLRLWQFLNIGAAVFALTMNGLANGLPLFGKNTGELSDLYPNLFVPAGITFSIWGLIYLLLIAFLVYQFRDASKDKIAPVALGTKPWLFINLMMNGLWIIAWHATQLWLSVAIMLTLLFTLIQLNIILRARSVDAPKGEKWFTRVFASVYLGWISVATIANVTALLVDLGFDGGGAEVMLTAAMIIIATVLGLIFVLRRGDWAYGFVIVWALGGILYKRLSIPESPELLTTILYPCIGLVVVAIVFNLVKGKPAL